MDTDLTSHKGHKSVLDGRCLYELANIWQTEDAERIEPLLLLGADTPFYLATLPEGAKEPNAKFISERKVVDVDSKVVY